MAKIIVVTSGKGGVGKTTTSASFATGLALRGHKTAVIDFDVGLRNLDLIMGCERRVVYDLINVIQGRMSLVGPRPHAVSHNELYRGMIKGYMIRHKVKPGMTGWAQVHGWRGETDTEEKLLKRLEHDLYYIENWSVLLDFYILIKTPFSLMTKTENAY